MSGSGGRGRSKNPLVHLVLSQHEALSLHLACGYVVNQVRVSRGPHFPGYPDKVSLKECGARLLAEVIRQGGKGPLGSALRKRGEGVARARVDGNGEVASALDELSVGEPEQEFSVLSDVVIRDEAVTVESRGRIEDA